MRKVPLIVLALVVACSHPAALPAPAPQPAAAAGAAAPPPTGKAAPAAPKGAARATPLIAPAWPLGARVKAVEAPRAMVVTSHPLASDVGVEILKRGGNAVDAAV